MPDLPEGTVAFIVLDSANKVVNRVTPGTQPVADAYADLLANYPSPDFTIQFFSDVNDPGFAAPTEAPEEPTPAPGGEPNA